MPEPDLQPSSTPLHMVQLRLDAKRMTEVGKMLRLPLRQADTNYLAHCLLAKLFGEQAPRPYWVDDDPRDGGRRRWLRVLGYSTVDAASLQELARAFSEPRLYEANDWARTASKPMPAEFPEGMRLRFELRACPVIRKASDGPKWRKGQEIDAFLSRVWEIDDESVPVEREEVYRDWLKQQFARRGGAEATRVDLDRFSIQRMLRRAQGASRKAHTIQRPDVTLSGALEITHSEAFSALLEKGIGRHRSFGFGMLKIRRQ